MLRVDGIHNLGTHFIIGRTIGTVFNPVVGGPDRVVNLESSVNTHYDALLSAPSGAAPASASAPPTRFGKALNYANDDQIPFANGPIDPNDLRREYGPAPNDQRHRFTLAGMGTRAGRHPGRAAADAGVWRADGHPDARRTVARARVSAQCRRPAVQDRAPT